VYLQEAEKEPTIVRIIHDSHLLQLVVAFTHHLKEDTIGSVITFILHLLAFDKGDSRDRNTRSLVSQFIQASGMGLFARFRLLKQGQEGSASLMESCNLLSQIARHSKEVYEHIDGIDPYEDIRRLMGHPDPQVRSRALNLIGNMCRHSGFFYAKLQAQGILKQCIALCEDEDKTIKKFACVAIGNASFHDDSLYEPLRPSIPILVSLLKDSEEKTRSNAAAALGNLARNSQLLDKDFINTGANYQLVNMLGQDKSNSAKKVSIMAIINLLELPESKKVLLSLEVSRLLQKVLSPPLSSDIGLVKTAQKALEKLK
jgi:fused